MISTSTTKSVPHVLMPVTSIPDNPHPKTKHGCKHPCEV